MSCEMILIYFVFALKNNFLNVRFQSKNLEFRKNSKEFKEKILEYSEKILELEYSHTLLLMFVGFKAYSWNKASCSTYQETFR